MHLFVSTSPPPASSTLFPYTTLFRSWIAEVPELPGVMTYGKSRDEAMAHVQALALRVIADRLDHAETAPDPLNVTRSEEHTSELQSPDHLVCRLLLEKKKTGQRPEST